MRACFGIVGVHSSERRDGDVLALMHDGMSRYFNGLYLYVFF